MPTHEEQFRRNAVTFLRNHALSPPAGSAGDPIRSWTVANAGNVLEGATDAMNSTISLRGAGPSRQWVKFVPHNLFPRCFTVSLSSARADDAVPIYWLPWKTLSLTKIRIPPVPTSLVDPDEDTFPRFFMTAGINGCSVFVLGPSNSPTIMHAGIDGKLARSAGPFWREQLDVAVHGTSLNGRRVAEVNKDHYMLREAQVIERYKAWESSSRGTGFKLRVENCFGSCIGIRYGRHWSFYLQENIYVQDIQIYKSSQVDRWDFEGGSREYTAKGDESIKLKRDVTVTPRKYLKDKRTKTYYRSVGQRCVPVRVGEIYPSRAFSADFTTSFVAA